MNIINRYRQWCRRRALRRQNVTMCCDEVDHLRVRVDRLERENTALKATAAEQPKALPAPRPAARAAAAAFDARWQPVA